MIEVNGIQLDITYEQLLYDLRETLSTNGIQLLNTIKTVNDNVMISCPSHKGGQENKPSCGVSTVTKYKDDKVIEAGTVHCFSCGYTASLSEFISFCFGYQDGGIFGNKWLKAQYNIVSVKQRKVDLNISRGTIIQEELPTLSDQCLSPLRYTVDYMYQRGLTDEIIEQFDIGYDRTDDTITIPVPNLKGEVKWIQRRSISKKRYYIPSGVNKTDYLLGASEILRTHREREEVYIVESPFNMLTLWKLGYPAVCLFGTGGGKQYDMLKRLPIRHYILALDNDEAGKNGTKKLIKALDRYKMLSTVQYEDDRDINELDSDFNDLKIFPINF